MHGVHVLTQDRLFLYLSLCQVSLFMHHRLDGYEFKRGACVRRCLDYFSSEILEQCENSTSLETVFIDDVSCAKQMSDAYSNAML